MNILPITPPFCLKNSFRRPHVLLAMLLGIQPARALEELHSVPDAAAGQPYTTWASTQAADGFSYRTYESFSLASDAHVTQVTWTGVYIDVNPNVPSPPPLQTTTWRIGFFTNVAGQPGTQVHSVDIPAANVTSVFVSDEVWRNGNPLTRRRYTANLPTPAVLSSGVTYWFSPLSLQPSYNPHFSWWYGTGAGTCFQHQSQPPTDLTQDGNRAFTLRGGPPPPGISLSILGDTIASGGGYNYGTLTTGLEHGAVVHITNTGGSPLTGIAAAITPPGNNDFRIGIAPPASAVAGGSASFTVIFAPQGIGMRTGTLRVTSNGDPSPYLINLTGSGSDTVPPVINPHASVLNLVDGAAGNAAALTAWLAANGGAVATDNSGTVTWSHDYIAPPPGPGLSRTVTFTASDASNNTASTAVQLRMLDQTPPAITSPAADLTVNCSVPDRMDVVNAWLAVGGMAVASDNSGAFTWSHNFFTLPAACGTRNVTFKAEDASGNVSTTNAVLTVVDNTAPVITAPAVSTTVESNGTGNSAQRNAWLNTSGGAVATDNCSSGVSWSHNFTSLPNNLPQTVPVTFSVADTCGNSTSTTANFVIQDTTPPQITTPATDFYGDEGEAAADLASFLNTRSGAQATDIAGPVTWTNNYGGTPPPVGGYVTVTFTATDTVGLSASTTCRFFLFPPGRIWIGPATGFWSTNTNWRNTGGDHYVDLFDFQNTQTTMDGNDSVQNLYIGAGDAVDLNGSLTVFGTLIRNDGILRTRRVTDLNGDTHSLLVNGPVSLEGSGKIILNNPGRNAIYSTAAAGAAGVLTVGAQQEISTSGATSSGYQGTTIHAGLVNHGTLTADGGGLNLFSLPKSNDGIFRAINGGHLEIQSPVDNTGGTVRVGSTSTVILQNTLTGGSVTGPGSMLINANAGLIGPMLLDTDLTTALDGGITTLTGTVTNNGLLTFGSATGTGTSLIRVNGSVTLNGNGRVLIQNLGRRQLLATTNAATDILTVGAQQEITTDHRTDSNYQSSSLHTGIVNHGAITADSGQLSLYDVTKTNHGTMRAINGGFLDIESDVINTNATLFAGVGSTLHLESTVTGGTITGPGTLLINSNCGLSGPLLLDSGLTTALDGAGLWLTGTVTNNGLLHFGSNTSTGTAYIYVNGAVSLEGTGKIILRNSGRRQLLSANGAATDVLTVGAQQEITTDSRTGLNYQSSALHAPMVINGTVTADGGGLTIYSGAKTNNGTMRALNGGYMDFASVTVTNYNATTDTLAGGRWEVVSNGPVTTMDLTSMPIVNLAAGTTVRLSGANAVLAQLSSLRNISGKLVLENGKTLATSGNMVIPGVLQYGLPAATETTCLAITGNVDFTGARIDVTDLGLATGSYLLASWTGTVIGMPVLGSLPPASQHTLVLDPVAKTLRLQVFSIPPLKVSTFTIVPGTGPNLGQNVVTLAGDGYPNAGYILQASDDLKIWTPISGTLTSPIGAISYSFTQSPTLTRRFFRFQTQ